MTERLVRLHAVPVACHHDPAQVFVGGTGRTLLLLHGGWGDAALHWSRVWEPLAARYRVIAPELPGFGPLDHAPCDSVPKYVTWLLGLLDALGVDRVFGVGNSMGASVAWSLAGRAPDRCVGVALVNGYPIPSTPPPLLWLGRTRGGSALLSKLMSYAFRPRVVRRAFVHPDRVPPGVVPLLATRGARLLANFTKVAIEGDGSPPPRVEPVLLWGAGDRLPHTSRHDAERLHATIPGARLLLLEGAGHFPQLEVPEAFVQHLVEIIASVAAPPAPADGSAVSPGS